MSEETEAEKNQRHAKMSEGVAQIGRLVGVCAQQGLGKDDILIMLQTSTSLTIEMNAVPIDWYMQFLFVLHKKRTDPTFDGSDPAVVRAHLRKLFTAEGEEREWMI